MVDTETDYLRADFLYLSLFKRCSIIIRPYVLPRKLEGLMNILDIFYQIEHFDTENMDMLYEEENLELLMEHYATSGNGGSEALTGNEKPTFLFLPQVTKDMHPTLAKFPEVGFLAIQLMGSKNEIPTEAYERVALYDKKRGKIAKLKPASLLDEQSKKDPRYEWCEQVIGMCKASSLVSSSGSSSGNPSSPTSGNSSDSSPDGSPNNSKGSG
ncbi:MAG TPA: hypothetical protein VKO42_05525, partial [Patescibacteria group bacterium]|nr:hypothetical protein [Patescibacteria group bacterium]